MPACRPQPTSGARDRRSGGSERSRQRLDNGPFRSGARAERSRIQDENIQDQSMSHQGSCHCGKVEYEVEGDFDEVLECNCSHCSRKGYLLWFVPRDKLKVKSGENDLATYTFNKHVIKHQFCPTCGCGLFGFSKGPKGDPMAAINVRCLEDVELSTLKRKPFDGRSL